MTESELLDLYAARDERALAETQSAYGALLLRVAKSVTGNDADAEECVSDTLHDAWRALEHTRVDSVKAYLLRTVRNHALDTVRRENRQKRGGGSQTVCLDELCECLPADDETESRERSEHIARVLSDWLRTLDAPKRNAFVLRYYYELPLHEVARRLGFTDTKTANLLARLRAALKTVLTKEELL